MKFEFTHPVTGEVKIVSHTDQEIQNLLADHLYDELGCDCEPAGETNVVECNCEDYLCEFKLQNRCTP